MRRTLYGLIVLILFSFCLTRSFMPASAAPQLQLTPDLPSGQYVGTPVTWSVATDETDPVDFALIVTPPGAPPRIVYDFTTRRTFGWTALADGLWHVRVMMRNLRTGELTSASVDYEIMPRAVAAPVVTPADNALIALYSAPSCAIGKQMRLLFRPVAGGAETIIPPRACALDQSMNFYVAGILPQTPYIVVHQILDANGNYLSSGPPRYFTSGAVSLPLPDSVVLHPPDAATSLAEDILLHSPAASVPEFPGIVPFATDLYGRPIWYYEKPAPFSMTLFQITPEVTLFASRGGNDNARAIYWMEIDVAGNIVRETNVHSLNMKLAALGYPPMSGFHHDSRRLPNGYTAILGISERLLYDVQGTGWVDILGDYVLVLDEQMNLVWVWDSFDHLDVERRAVLDEKCLRTDDWCVPLYLADEANDWLHTNTVAYSPADHNLILSLRNQDWVVKIDYQDGLGSGDVIWRLGNEGDFTLLGGGDDPWPWFSHAHDTVLLPDGVMLLYDNGNTRCELDGLCYSRGQAYQLDEANLTATLFVNVDLGEYAKGFGSAQRLHNGDYAFLSGTLVQHPAHAVATERSVDGQETFAIWVQTPLYRTFRLPSFYPNP